MRSAASKRLLVFLVPLVLGIGNKAVGCETLAQCQEEFSKIDSNPSLSESQRNQKLDSLDSDVTRIVKNLSSGDANKDFVDGSELLQLQKLIHDERQPIGSNSPLPIHSKDGNGVVEQNPSTTPSAVVQGPQATSATNARPVPTGQVKTSGSDSPGTQAVNPNSLDSQRRLAQSLIQQGRPDEAAAVAKKMLAQDPNNKFAQMLAGPSAGVQRASGVTDKFKNLVQSFLHGQAEENFSGGGAAAASKPAATAATVGNAFSSQRTAEMANAQQSAFTATSLGAGGGQFVASGWTRFRLGDFQAARDHASLALTRNPADAKALTLRAAANNRSGQPEAALADADSALKIEPRNVVAMLERGYAKYQLRRYHEALDDVESALSMDPLNAMGHLYRGMILEKLARTKDALAAYFRAGELDPSLKPLTDEAAARLGGAPGQGRSQSRARAWNFKRVGIWGGGTVIALMLLGFGLRRTRNPDWATPATPIR